jgi:hypothetical protein
MSILMRFEASKFCSCVESEILLFNDDDLVHVRWRLCVLTVHFSLQAIDANSRAIAK